MPRDISGRCIAHTNELASDLCSTCGDEFCAGCLVGTTSSKRSLCVGCALAAAGVRSTARKRVRPIGGRELRKRREASERIRHDATERAAQIDNAPWRLLNSSLATATRPDPELARRDLLEPVVPAHSAVDPELTAAAFASRDREAMDYPPIDTTVGARRRLEPTRPTEPASPTRAPQPPLQPPEFDSTTPSRSLARVWSGRSSAEAAAPVAPAPVAAKTAPAPPWRRRARPEDPSASPSVPATAPVDITDQATIGQRVMTSSPTGSPWATPPAALRDPDADTYRPAAWAGFTPERGVDGAAMGAMPMRAPRFTGAPQHEPDPRELAGAAARPSRPAQADEWVGYYTEQ